LYTKRFHKLTNTQYILVYICQIFGFIRHKTFLSNWNLIKVRCIEKNMRYFLDTVLIFLSIFSVILKYNYITRLATSQILWNHFILSVSCYLINNIFLNVKTTKQLYIFIINYVSRFKNNPIFFLYWVAVIIKKYY
jgi:hypothetical protein